MGWMLFFMLIVLKIPLAGAGWLIWYAIKAEPELGRGARERRGPRPAPEAAAPRPRWPRRGPVGGGAGCKPPPCPQEHAGYRWSARAPAYARRSA